LYMEYWDVDPALSPITFELVGYGLGLRIAGENRIKNLLKESFLKLANLANFDLELHEIEVAFDQAPLTLEGVFLHRDNAAMDDYAVGIAVGFPPYQFVAIGEYAEAKVKDESYKSVFVSAKLRGPLINVKSVTIEGVRIGFGYSSAVTLPAVD
jgi:hypothetical protein